METSDIFEIGESQDLLREKESEMNTLAKVLTVSLVVSLLGLVALTMIADKAITSLMSI